MEVYGFAEITRNNNDNGILNRIAKKMVEKETRKLKSNTIDITDLESITEKLSKFEDLVEMTDDFTISMRTETIVENVDFKGLIKEDNLGIVISDGIIQKGTVFSYHVHDENEWIGVYEGKMRVEMYGKNENIDKFNAIMIPAKCPHKIIMLEDTKVWAITMPASKSFPGGNN